jgi:RNA polymerase sigma-70 factor (ECF subfamily)
MEWLPAGVAGMNPGEASRQRELFADHLRQCRGRLFGYIHAMVRNLADADDVFQLTTVALWRRFDRYEPSRPFLAWACGVARLEAATWLRNQARKRLRFSDDLTALLIDAFAEIDDKEFDDRQAALPGCLDKLPDADRKLLAECYDRGTEVAAVAERMGRSPSSVHNTLRRIRRNLFECIERSMARSMRS